MRRALLALSLLASASSGCVVARRFDGATQAALAHAEMQTMETDSLRLYYPAAKREQAMRFAGRVEGCVGELRKLALVHGARSDRKIDLVFPDVPLNNAYVMPAVAGEPVGVVPTHATTDVFSLFGLPPDPGFVACHEVVHYVQSLQVAGFPGFLVDVFGDAYTPQIGLDSWFWEGLAVYYETKLQGGGGRLGSRYWDGVFRAGVAGHGIDGGDLSDLHRQTPYGSHYVVGSHFIDWLARKHGPEKLWEVVRNQAGAVLFPFGVNTRFKSVYGVTLATLIDEFDAEIRAWSIPAKPPEQRAIRALGSDARYERGADGSEAIVDAAQDQPTTLRVFDRHGTQRLSRRLVDVLPPRKLITASPLSISGLSFTRDGSRLYFAAVDLGPVQQTTRLIRVDVDTGKVIEVVPDLAGAGGSLDPDGRKYVFSRAIGDRWVLAEIDLITRVVRTLGEVAPRTYVIDPQVSPDGKRVLATVFHGERAQLEIFDRNGALLSVVPGPSGPTTEGRWIDDGKVSFVADDAGRLQVFAADLAAGAYRRVSDAPFLAYRPRPFAGRVRFLDRAGWRWSLDELALPTDAPPTTLGEDAMPAADYPAPPTPLDAVPKSHAAESAIAPVEHAPHVIRDGPYSQLEGFFRPQVRGPTLSTTRTSTAYGLGAIGGDKLGFHRWGLTGLVDPLHRLYSGSVEYLNATQAPWYFGLSASHVSGWTGLLDDKDEEIDHVITRETVASLDVLREWFGNTFGARLQYLGLMRQHANVTENLRFVGPSVDLRWAAVEGTAYAGARRALVLVAEGSYYPEGANAARWSLADVRSAFTGVVPLPLSARHTFRLAGRLRRLLGTPIDLLQVGGSGGMVGRSATLEVPEIDPRDLLPPSLQLSEPLRGFEDLGVFARGVGVVDATYRYPIIVDWGSASSLWLLPAFFLRQIDLEVFGMAASLLDGSRPLASTGASASLRFSFYRTPLSIGAQIARRLTYDERWVGFGSIGFDI